MTKKELQQYLDLTKECEHLHQTVEQKEREITAIKSQQVNDMPGGGKIPTLEDIIIEIADLKEEYHRKYLETLRKCQEIENTIESLAEPLHRNIMRLKYIEGLAWWQVQAAVGYEHAQIHREHSKILKLIA